MSTSSQNPTNNSSPAPEPMSDGLLAEIRKRVEAAYPGPWRWRGNTEARHMRLQSPNQGGMTVMDFTRWGMNGAQPRFAIDRMMHKAEELVVYEVAAWSKDIYRKDLVGIDHPDAEFIAAAREDVPALLAEVDRLRAELAKARRSALTEAITAARGEYLNDGTGTPEDEAYNQAVTDVSAAIDALNKGGA